jgi:hypothetical protein
MKISVTLVILLTLIVMAPGQDAVKSDVHLFQTFLRDAPVSTPIYGEAGLSYLDYEFANQTIIYARGGYPITPKIEMNMGLGFSIYNSSFGDNKSGLTDIAIAGRYLILDDNNNVSAGAYLTLPTGSDDIFRQNNFNFGAFAAIRQPLSQEFVVSGVLGMDFIEIGDKREAALLISIGSIYAINEQLHLVGELKFQSRLDDVLLSGGVDYALNEKGRLRGALGFGLDNGAPDFMLMGSYLVLLR